MVPDPLGGHLTSTWMRFRDQFTWFPWPSRDVTRLNPYDRPSPEDIDLWVSMFYRGCGSYGPAYRAACHYGQAAIEAAAALRVPAIYTATVEDMLHPHLARLPALQPDQRIAPLPSAIAEKSAALVGYLRELPGGDAPPPPAPAAPVGRAPALLLTGLPGAQVFARCTGDPSRPKLLIAHDTPGTSLACDALAHTLASDFFVVVPDLPGCGQSAPPDPAQPILPQAADALVAIAGHFGWPRFALLGLGTGAAAAAALAARNDPRLSTLLLHAPPSPDEGTAAQIAPDINLSPEGAHWVRAWLMLRDAQIYAPWFAGTRQSQRRSQGNFDAAWLHAQTCALMEGRATYHLLPRAAWRFDIDAALRAATAPLHILPPGSPAPHSRALLLKERIDA
jgi:pimeloyl-ACP methyl ester carboxylesterase